MNKDTSRKDFISEMLEQRNQYGLSEIQLSAHASDFVIAGSETTATTLSCVTYYLCRNAEITRKIQEEVRGAFESYEQIDGNSTTKLNYLQAVCLEAMRLFPPLPLALPRVVPPGGDTVDGYFLPEGTIVSTAPIAASCSSSNFKDPWSFRPERWLGENKDDVLEASQPFSYGVRSCLGRNLGWLELRTILAKIHYLYDLSLVNKELDWQRDSRMHTLWKKPPLMVKLRRCKDTKH